MMLISLLLPLLGWSGDPLPVVVAEHVALCAENQEEAKPGKAPGMGAKDDDKGFVETYRGQLLILVMFVILVAALMVLVPQLLRAHLRKGEMLHAENMRAL